MYQLHYSAGALGAAVVLSLTAVASAAAPNSNFQGMPGLGQIEA